MAQIMAPKQSRNVESTIVRFEANGWMNIRATVEATAAKMTGRRGTFNAEEIMWALSSQGVEITRQQVIGGLNGCQDLVRGKAGWYTWARR